MVASSVRGSGVGRALMASAEHWAHSVRCSYLALASRRAGPFYEAPGYDAGATWYRKTFSPAVGT